MPFSLTVSSPFSLTKLILPENTVRRPLRQLLAFSRRFDFGRFFRWPSTLFDGRFAASYRYLHPPVYLPAEARFLRQNQQNPSLLRNISDVQQMNAQSPRPLTVFSPNLLGKLILQENMVRLPLRQLFDFFLPLRRLSFFRLPSTLFDGRFAASYRYLHPPMC